MSGEVYIDVLIFENFIMNYLILHITNRYMKCKATFIWLSCGAAIGVVYAVVAVLFPLSSFLALPGKIFLSALMIFVSFRPPGLSVFLKILLCFYIITFLFAGVAFGVIIMGNSAFGDWGSVFVNNGIMMFKWESPVNFLFLVVIAGYLASDKLFGIIKERRKTEECQISVYIEYSGNGLWIPALIDTGNELKDPFTGRPVMIAEFEAVRNILPDKMQAFMMEASQNSNASEQTDVWENEWASRFRMIPFSSIGCENGLLPAFRADVVKVKGEKDVEAERIFENKIVCLYFNNLSQNYRYRALLPAEFAG